MQNKFIQKIAGSLLLFTIVFLSGQSIQAQLKVGSNPGTLNAGAILEVESTNRGFLPPRVALASTTTFTLNGGALATSDGMMVYNTATAGAGATAVAPGFYIWQGGITGSWRAVVASTTTTLGNASSVNGKVTIGGTTTGSVLKDLTFNVNESLFDLSTMGATGTLLPVTKLAVGAAGQVLTMVGTVPTWQTPAAGGINSLGGSTVASQTFGTPTTTGTALAFSTNTTSGVHTLNIPLASVAGVTAGLLSKTDYDSFNAKENALTFNNGLTRTGNTIALGGANPLLAATTINQATFNLTFSGTTGNTIFSSNNVGIGTTAPANKLHVVGTNPLKLVGLQTLTPVATDSVLVFSGAGGVIRRASVNSLVGAGVTASNGLTEAAGVVELGGALTKNTTVAQSAFNMTFSGTGRLLGPSGGFGFPGDTRRGVAAIWNASTGNAYGMENVNSAQTGNTFALRIFGRDGSIVFGAYTDSTAFTESGRFRGGNFGVGTNNPLNKLHAVGTDPLRLVGLQAITPVGGDSVLVYSSAGGGVIKRASITSINTAVATTNALTNTGTAAAPTLTSTVNGVPAVVTLPTASATNTGLLSNTDFTALQTTATNGLTKTGNAFGLGGTLGAATNLVFGTNNLTFNASSTGQFIVAGPTGNTAGLRLSNLTGTATAGAIGQKVLSVNASGDVTLVTDVSPISSVTPGNGLTLTSGVLAMAPTAAADITSAANVTAGSTKVTLGGTPTGAALKAFSVDVNEANLILANIGGTLPITKIAGAGTAGQVLTSTGPSTAPTFQAIPASTNIYNADGTLTGNRTVTQGANTLNFTGTGVTTFNSGNVGIGTTAPASKLVISQNAGVGSLKLSMPTAAAGDFNWIGFSHGDNSTDANDRARVGLVMSAGGLGNLAFTTGAGGSQVERIRIDGVGNVGIGTTAPTRKLDIASTDNDGIRIGQIGYVGNTAAAVGAQTAQFNIDFTGYRDIGQNQVGARIAALRFNNFNNGNPAVQNTGLAFYTNPTGLDPFGAPDLTERMRIAPSGNVGIGTTAPSNKLHVAGTDPLKLVGLVNITPASTDSVLVFSGAGGVIKRASISSVNAASPTPITNALTNTGTAAAPTLTSTVNGVAAVVTLPTASATNTGLLSNADYASFNAKESALTFNNGLTRATNTIGLGGTLGAATTLAFGTNNLTFDASGTGKFIVGGATGNTSGLRLSNLTGTATAGTVGQKVLSVDASGNVTLVTDVSPISSVTPGNGLTLTSGVLAMAPTAAADITSAANVTAGSTKVTLGGTPTGAALKAFSVDVNEANLSLATIGSGNTTLLPVTKLATGTTGQILQVSGTTPTWVTPTASAFGGWSLTGNTIAASTPVASRRLGTVSNYSLPIITNNTERMRVDSLGNVGIGTTAPEVKLHVVSTAASTGAVKFESTGTGTAALPTVSVTANATGATLSNGFGPQFNLSVQKGTASEIPLARIAGARDGADNTGAITFSTSTVGTMSERMRIDGTAGRVGINTTSPLGRLHIQGTGVDGDTLLWLGANRNFFFHQGLTSTVGGSQYLGFRSTSNRSLKFLDQDAREFFSINPSGTASSVNLNNSYNSSILKFDFGVVAGATGTRIYSNDTLELQSGSSNGANANQIALLPNGFVSVGSYGVASPTPTSTLDVNGSVSNSINKITSATILNATHYTILANATAAGFTITLPTASTVNGRVYIIRKTDETSNAITFAETGNATTNIIRVTETTYINTLNYVKTLRVQSDGTNWYLID